MTVSGHYALQRLARQWSGQHGIPRFFAGIQRHAAIDRAPTAFFAQQPQVDVVEGKRQRQPHPRHTGRDFEHRAAGRQGVAKWIVKLGFERVHGVQ